MKLGIQCFGLQNMPLPDPKEFFAKLYGFGYRLVEPCINFGGKLPFDFWSVWPACEAVERGQTLRSMGFEILSAHIFGDISQALPEMVRIGKALGIKQYVAGLPKDVAEESLRAAAADYAKAAAALREHGMELLVHNGGGQGTATRLGGKTAYEFFLDQCGELVGAQPDIGWVAAGGEDPAGWVERNRSRLKSIHYKDYAGGKEMPVGKGDVDHFSCFKAACEMGIPHIIDMDTCTLPDIESAAQLITGFASRRDWTESVLCTLDVDSGELTELHRFDGIIEAPNWSGDDCLYYNADGLIYRYALQDGRIEKIDTGMCTSCNNDHVLSADGARLGVSHMVFEGGFSSKAYIVDLTGKEEPRLVTPCSPSFLHGWSGDGEMAYCAFRDEDGRRAVDIYTIPEQGGEERRLTDGIGYNDGPEYSPDGRHIWFNSTRDGLMQLYRIDRDGTNLTRMSHTEDNEWFPHVSPDGKRVVYLTFKKGDLDPHQHVANLNVSLSVMDYDGSGIRKLADFFGGQGTINVNSWSPDSKKIAFVKYEVKKGTS